MLWCLPADMKTDRVARHVLVFLILFTCTFLFLSNERWINDRQTFFKRMVNDSKKYKSSLIRYLQEMTTDPHNFSVDKSKQVSKLSRKVSSDNEFVNTIDSRDFSSKINDRKKYVSNGSTVQTGSKRLLKGESYPSNIGSRQTNTDRSVQKSQHNEHFTDNENVKVNNTSVVYKEKTGMLTDKWIHSNRLNVYHSNVTSAQLSQSKNLLNMTFDIPKSNRIKMSSHRLRKNLFSNEVYEANTHRNFVSRFADFDGKSKQVSKLTTPVRSHFSDNGTAISENIRLRVDSKNGSKAPELRNKIIPDRIFEQDGQNKIKIGVLIPTTTRDILNFSFQNFSLVKTIIPSLHNTSEKQFVYRIYIGIDKGDRLETVQDEIKTMFDCEIVNVHGKNFVKSVNTMAERAYNDHMDYLVRVNDDTEFVSFGWASLAIAMLESYNPKNIGVVGPTCKEGNTVILTHDMVHKTHLEIFGFYYPPYLENWWADDWMTRVYEPFRSVKLKSWVVKHTLTKRRYSVDCDRAKWWKTLVEFDKKRFQKFLGHSCPYKNDAGHFTFFVLGCLAVCFIICLIVSLYKSRKYFLPLRDAVGLFCKEQCI